MNYYLGDVGNQNGIGDFLCLLPCIDYYTIDLKANLYFHTAEKFKCLLPKRENLILVDKIHGLEHNNGHPTAGWLPKIEKFQGNHLRTEPFVYPEISYDPNIEKFLLSKYPFLSKKPIITYVRLTADENRNWENHYWDRLIEKLHEDFLFIELGSKINNRNSEPYSIDQHSISLGDELDLYQIAHLIKLSECFISGDTGMFHLATAIKCKKVIVLIKNKDYGWIYPNTTTFDISDGKGEMTLEHLSNLITKGQKI